MLSDDAALQHRKSYSTSHALALTELYCTCVWRGQAGRLLPLVLDRESSKRVSCLLARFRSLAVRRAVGSTEASSHDALTLQYPHDSSP